MPGSFWARRPFPLVPMRRVKRRLNRQIPTVLMVCFFSLTNDCFSFASQRITWDDDDDDDVCKKEKENQKKTCEGISSTQVLRTSTCKRRWWARRCGKGLIDAQPTSAGASLQLRNGLRAIGKKSTAPLHYSQQNSTGR